MEQNRKQALFSWIFVGVLFTLAAILGVLQYRWIGEVSHAEREQLRETLQGSLRRLSQDFNAELTLACTRLIPEHNAVDEPTEQEYAAHYLQWRETSRHNHLFRRIALAMPDKNALVLKELDLEQGVFQPIAWPAEWQAMKERLTARLSPDSGPNRRPPGFMGDDFGPVLDLPYFVRPEPGGTQGLRVLEWLIVEINTEYVRETMIPELVRRHLGSDGEMEYDIQVVARDNPAAVIFQSEPTRKIRSESDADAYVYLFEVRPDLVFRRSAGARMDRGPDQFSGRRPGMRRRGPPPENGGFEHGRWQMLARHRSGSLEAVVAKARTRNLAVSMVILLLIVATVFALVRFTRRAQKLAELQMEFVAGVSHELRTPLTVMRTAGHNLQGRVASDPAKVQRYGSLIQAESEKLTAIVEQILGFANGNAGRVIGAKEEVSVEAVLDEALDASRRAIDESGCVLDKRIAQDLPRVLGDPTTLKHAIQNLLVNAAKYGKKGDWIGISANVDPADSSTVEIRIADHGDGIPSSEISQIFEPFYRGKKAIEEQIHGTGLGLSLTRRIVEAHDGKISVESELGRGATFVVRIPALPVGQQHEFANSTD